MADEILCPVCESPNDPWNEVCDACGAELHAPAAAETDHDDDAFDLLEDTGAEETSLHGEPTAANMAEHKETVEFDLDEFAASEGAPSEASDDNLTTEYDLGAEDSSEAEAPIEDEFAAGYNFEVDPSEASETEDDDSFDEWAGEDSEPAEAEAAGDAAYELEEEAPFDDDELVADGGMALEADSGFESFGADSDAGLEDFGADSDADDAAPAADSDVDFDEFDEPAAPNDEEAAAESEADEELPPPPELDAILNPERIERAAIEPLPQPGPYQDLATLRVYRDGEQLGEVAIDFACTVLGLDQPDDADDAPEAEPESVELELDALEPLDEEPDEAPYELEAIDAGDEESSFGFEEEDNADGENPWDTADSEADEANDADEAAAEPTVYEDPEDLEEGPVVDLSQFGDADAFARRHGYVFRQNKNYTLYVLSDMGTQLNDELLAIGDHRQLNDGDVIIVGGEVALQFSKPAA